MTTATSRPLQHPSRADDDNDNDDVTLSAPKASEKRRAQNRAAQKTYREKRKRRLQQLEQLAASAASANLLSNSRSSSSSQSPPESNGLMDRQSTSSLEPLENTLPDAAFDSTSLFQSDHLLIQPFSLDAPTSEAWGSSKATQSLDLEWITASNDLSSFDNIPDPFAYTENMGLVRITSESDSSDSNSHDISKPEWKSRYKDTKNSFAMTPYRPALAPRHADPYLNTLTLHQTTVCWAFYQNVLHIGLDENLCSSEIPSPFYRPDAVDSNDTLIKSVQNTFSCLKPDLRPTKAQITIAHPGYVDALPFPEVRSRIIELLAHDPPLFDEDEFWQDIEKDALMCWGSISIRPGNHTTAGGAPWNARSWEAKTWFLAKWSFVVGGEDGELSKSSAWWREMRGVSQGFSL